MRWTDIVSETPDKVMSVSAPPILYHGTTLEALCDILLQDSMIQLKVRDRGPVGISFTSDPAIAVRFARARYNPNSYKPTMSLGGMIVLDGHRMEADGHEFVHYRGTYSKKESEFRMLGQKLAPVSNYITKLVCNFYTVNMMTGFYRYDDGHRPETIDGIIAEMRRIGNSDEPVHHKAPMGAEYLQRADVLEHWKSKIEITTTPSWMI